MSKFECLFCDFKTNREKLVEIHQAAFSDHIIATRGLKSRIMDWILRINYHRGFRLFGVILIILVVEKHFNMSFEEGFLLSLGAGLLVD